MKYLLTPRFRFLRTSSFHILLKTVSETSVKQLQLCLKIKLIRRFLLKILTTAAEQLHCRAAS